MNKTLIATWGIYIAMLISLAVWLFLLFGCTRSIPQPETIVLNEMVFVEDGYQIKTEETK